MKTICKVATMTKCYPLSGGWVSSRNHWNNRAAVIECKGGYTALQSYSTIVCVLYRGKLYRTWSGYSRTTANHISRFCEMNGLRAFLLENDIYFEISATGFFCGWHFEINASAAEAEKINAWLDANTIYCEGVH